MDDKILEVNNLKISFRTSSGKVQAVRNISFELNKGETLAIVGESGSGKSVTSKAVIGIYSNNAIIESGEILYDGQDLLKIDERTFQDLRGNKIAMIFQDPMSSLNPIIKVGKQLTEAMIVKERNVKKDSQRLFNSRLRLLEKNLLLSDTKTSEEEIKNDFKKFKTFEYRYLKLQKKYNRAKESAEIISKSIKEILFQIEKKSYEIEKSEFEKIYRLASKTIHENVVFEKQKELETSVKEFKKYLDKVSKTLFIYRTSNLEKAFSENEQAKNEFMEILSGIKQILDDALSKQSPNFFAMGYYLSFVDENIPEKEISELNQLFEKYLNEFLEGFTKKIEQALIFYNTKNFELKQIAKEELTNNLNTFQNTDNIDKKKYTEVAKKMIDAVNNAINLLDLKKSTKEYVFGVTLQNYLKRLFVAGKSNQKEEKRFAKEQAKIDKIISKGKVPEWKPIPASIIDEKLVITNIQTLINDLIKHYDEVLKDTNQIDYHDLAIKNIEELKNNASKVVFSLNKKMIKERAINILEEVGINEPRKRYNQYPFEFSGGMRQRIVIAIALVANPDILICDEPTTALDVTIQSTILELINKLKKERELSVIFITHDLGVVAKMADKVAVMYAGKIVEIGTTNQIFYNPRHPYTWALLSSMPDLDTNERLEAIPGTPPNMIYPPVGDAFAARNKYAMEIDFEEEPPMFKVEEGHFAATWLLHPDAPKVDIPDSILARIERMKKGSAKHGN